MSLLRNIVGAASELLTIRDPYEHYVPPEIVSETRDGCGHVVQQTVRADNHEQATRHLQGMTIQGNRSIVASRVRRGLWSIHIEDWRNQPPRGGWR